VSEHHALRAARRTARIDNRRQVVRIDAIDQCLDGIFLIVQMTTTQVSDRPEGPGDLPFPDDRSWERYREGGGRLARDDWRRKNVDDFVHELYAAVKAEKPWLAAASELERK